MIPSNNKNESKPVCKFFLVNKCKFGQNCNLNHPKNKPTQDD